jgi:hypothetical protein
MDDGVLNELGCDHHVDDEIINRSVHIISMANSQFMGDKCGI